ncbi:hypothetical protein Lal_00037461 [Lupinus albus]|uniref:RING-type E3 ubiquitin transferase n=1 Tax=Lupinus albus TaxID=3870 RepID=A0A6A4NVE2_LUPAL|nr:putative transcription factor C2H2 family [Lupinus albus]KAF1890890.1 hypothetical protein Lal_00037461 [Lupinus albus]
MASFTSSSLSHIPPFSSAAFHDDSYEDSCSICLEPFNTNEPPTITCCKHDYHLHCILEWSQRSKECPICWQSLALEDSASQELLDAVEAEKRLTSRNRHSSSFTSSHDDSSSDDSGFDEQIMQHLIAAAESRARFVHRRERQRSSGVGPSDVLVFNSSVHLPEMQPILSPSPSGGSSPTPGVPSAVDIQPLTAAFPPVNEVATNTTPRSDVPFRPRVVYSHTPSESARRLNTSDMFSVPESFKSKFSAASARYKESISKSTRGLKEKLLAHNSSVKDLSKGVQREMNAGIASVTRMIERLDLTSKWSASPLSPLHTEGTSGLPVKGKSIEENSIGHGPCEESGDLVRDVNSDAPSLVSRMVVSRAESPPRVQNGHDAVKT